MFWCFQKSSTTECMPEYVIYSPKYLLDLTLCKHSFLGCQCFSTIDCAAEEPLRIFVTTKEAFVGKPVGKDTTCRTEAYLEMY